MALLQTTTEHPYTPHIRAYLLGKSPADLLPYVQKRIAGDITQAPPAKMEFDEDKPENILTFTANVANDYLGHHFGQRYTQEEKEWAESIIGKNERDLECYLTGIVTVTAGILSENARSIAHNQGDIASELVRQANRCMNVLYAVADSGGCEQWDDVYRSLKPMFKPRLCDDLRTISASQDAANKRIITSMRRISWMCLNSLANSYR